MEQEKFALLQSGTPTRFSSSSGSGPSPASSPEAVQAQDGGVSGQGALRQLDQASFSLFHVKAILISGIGFFTDAYDLFLVSLVVPMIGFARYPALHGKVPIPADTAIKGVALIGTLLGQVTFGVLGDLMGRKGAYGLTLIIMIVTTIASALTSFGPNTVVVCIFCFWRLLLGIGIGGDYPLSAVITSEYANRNRRGAMVAAVFSMQGLGMLASSVVVIVVLRLFKSRITQCELGAPCTVLDDVWRVCVVLGAIPAAATYWLRKTLPETPRFTMHVQQDVELASRHVADVMADRPAESGDTSSATPAAPPTPGCDDDDEGDEVLGISDVSALLPGQASAGAGTARKAAVKHQAPEPVSWNAFKLWLSENGNRKVLFGCCVCWFLLDVVFYSNSLFTPTVLQDVGYLPTTPPASIYTKLHSMAAGNALVALAGGVPGYWLAVGLVEVLGRKPLQAGGFVGMAILLTAMAGLHGVASSKVSITLFALNNLFANAGPNTTTFIVPGEVFPTRFRSTCHGLSAACGKAGAILGAFVFGHMFEAVGTSATVAALAVFAAAGALCTVLVPESKGRSLEELSGESLGPD